MLILFYLTAEKNVSFSSRHAPNSDSVMHPDDSPDVLRYISLGMH